jgi:hypothetical protein
VLNVAARKRRCLFVSEMAGRSQTPGFFSQKQVRMMKMMIMMPFFQTLFSSARFHA